ncbi:MAG: hypothetical protein KAV87_59000 [Desulfobacteraceae bacterium]|nr:hypothetical protein [Desulfobacteraceae bacterium]
MPESPTVIQHILKLFREQYIPHVKEAILWLEVFSGERSKRSVYELKDALDHIAIALHPDTTEEKAEKSLNAVEEHFRRAAVEPAEWIALEELQKLLKIKKRGFWWWRLFFLKPPDSKEFDKKVFEGQEFVIKGREFKAISLAKSYGNFKKAYVTFRGLLRDIQPTELYSRIFAFILFVLGVIACIVTQLIFSASTN